MALDRETARGAMAIGLKVGFWAGVLVGSAILVIADLLWRALRHG